MKKLVVLWIIILFPMLCLAQEQQGRFAKGKGLTFFKELDLNPEQRQKLREFKDKRKGMRESFQALKERRESLQQLLTAQNLDEDKVRDQAKQLQDLQSKVFSQRIDNMLELRKILGPEKFAKLAQKFKQGFNKGRAERWGKHE